jgi:cytoskeletal protein RodZ
MVQLLINKLKDVKITGTLLLVFLVAATIVIANPQNILASPYGESSYGSEKYQVSDDDSPATSSDTSNSSSSAVVNTDSNDSDSPSTNTLDGSLDSTSAETATSSDNNESASNNKLFTIIGITALLLSAILYIIILIRHKHR